MTWIGEPIPGGWRYRHDEIDAQILIDYIIPKGDGLSAWVELRVGDSDVPVATGNRNLMAPKAPQPFVEWADGKSKVPTDEWSGGLDKAFYEVVEAWREGAATIDLATIDPADLVFYVDPLVEQGGNTRLIAPGGSGKSLFAMAVALTVATGSNRFLGLEAQRTGPVLYLDWETSQETHARRIKALCDAAGVAMPGRDLILYRNEALPLYRTMQAVHRAADRAEAVMLVVDSRQAAAGPSGQSSGEEAASNLHMALREIGRPALVIDHKTKEAVAKGQKGGFGSVFNTNWARMEWEFTKYQKVGENDHVFVLSLEKENNVGKLPALAYRLQTEGGKRGVTSARFTRVRPETVADPTPRDSLADSILELFVVSSEAMPVSRIAELTRAPESTVRSTLNRNKAMFENVAAKGKTGQWRPTEEYLGRAGDEGRQETLSQLEEVRVEDQPPVSSNGVDEPDGEPRREVEDEVEVW